MSDKFIIRYERHYREFLEAKFATFDLSDQEEMDFGGTSEAVDEYLFEFPEVIEEQNIEIPNPDFNKEY